MTIVSGSASIWTGLPDDTSHTLLTTLYEDDFYVITTDQPVSVQSESSFTYSLHEPASPNDDTPYINIIPALTPNQTPLDILPIYSASITTTASGSGLSILALLFLFLSFRLIYWVTHR